MLRCAFLCAFAISSLQAGVAITKVDGHIHVEVDGKPFTGFYSGPDTPKPYLHPLRSASGKIVTRGFPMENIPGESTTDQHHRGVWRSEEWKRQRQLSRHVHMALAFR
jgi:hypothetical protein